MLNIRYRFKIQNKPTYSKIIGIEGVENGCVEYEFKQGAQIEERDYSIELFDENNNEIFVNDIIKEVTYWDGTKFYQIKYEDGSFYAHEIDGISFNGDLNYGTHWSLSKFVINNKIIQHTELLGSIYDYENKTMLLK